MKHTSRLAVLIAVLITGCVLAIVGAMSQASTAKPVSTAKPTTTASPTTTARPASPVDIVAHTVFTTQPSAFESSLAGCEAGSVIDGPGEVHSTPSGGVFNGDKLFTCVGGESGFTVRLKARFGANGSTGSWNVKDGWGDLDGLKGSGSLVGTPTDAGIDDVYTGTVR
jgi:hypothetical protein